MNTKTEEPNRPHPATNHPARLTALEANDYMFTGDLRKEIEKARSNHPAPTTVHQSYGLLCEELAEFFDEVRKKRHQRDTEKMVAELVQIAAVAQRCATELLIPTIYPWPVEEKK